MSEDPGPVRWQPGDRRLGRLCAACGAPLRDHDAACPACGVPVDAPAHWGLMTPFGHGLCAFIGALVLGYAVTSVCTDVLPRKVVILGPVVLAILAAGLATQIGKRLAPQWRCSYEHLLIGGMIGGPAAATAALLGLAAVEGLLIIWGLTTAVVYLLMRRYGYRACDLR